MEIREEFVQQCRDAIGRCEGQQGVAELVRRVVSEPAKVLTALGEPTRAGVERLFVSDELTVLNLVWGPYMTLLPHNHNMWAVIGIYTGREDNIFWRRIEGEAGGKVKPAGARALGAKDVDVLGKDAIHSVTNPLARLTGALHVYGGEFFATPRSEWHPETLLEQRYDVERNMRLFEESNRRL
jgi:predicted metal-dependent enzyme (double-stranded beta helix superfamily)